jgi:hypothetical protein
MTLATRGRGVKHALHHRRGRAAVCDARHAGGGRGEDRRGTAKGTGRIVAQSPELTLAAAIRRATRLLSDETLGCFRRGGRADRVRRLWRREGCFGSGLRHRRCRVSGRISTSLRGLAGDLWLPLDHDVALAVALDTVWVAAAVDEGHAAPRVPATAKRQPGAIAGVAADPRVVLRIQLRVSLEQSAQPAHFRNPVEPADLAATMARAILMPAA